MASSDNYEISMERSRFDLDLIHRFLAESYWARDIPRSIVERSMEHSLGFATFHKTEQVGFARVVTDFATFAYIGDVFVVPEHRDRGVSKLLMRAIRSHPDLQGLRRIILATADAHGLYAQFGFQPLTHPEHFMTIHDADVYQRTKATPQIS